MEIGLRLAGGAARRWHQDLCAALRARGHIVSVTITDAAARAPAGLDLLMRFESLIYGHAGAGGGAGEACAMRDDSSAGRPGLIIDCAGGAAGADTARLVPLWQGQANETGAINAVLNRSAPLLQVALFGRGGGRVIAESSPGLEEPEIFKASFDRVCGRMGDLILQAVRLIAAGRAEGLETPLIAPKSLPTPAPVGFAIGSVAAKVSTRLKRLAVEGPKWRIGWRRAAGDAVIDTLAWPAAGYSILKDDGKRYFADPFLFRHEGVTHLFCEEVPYATGRGILSVLALGENGPAGPALPVLELPFHLSYPMMFERGGAVFMIPETCANRTIELWRAERFPGRWVKEAVLIDNVAASDATLIEHDGLLWIFAAIGEGPRSSWDALGLYWADNLLGPWHPHPDNPVVIDARCARPAGLMVRRGPKLLRPAQNCVGGYGAGLAIGEVTRLDREVFAQKIIARLPPPAGLRAGGAHTLNSGFGFEVIDIFGGLPN